MRPILGPSSERLTAYLPAPAARLEPTPASYIDTAHHPYAGPIRTWHNLEHYSSNRADVMPVLADNEEFDGVRKLSSLGGGSFLCNQALKTQSFDRE
jgi:hypothetical protein